MSDDCAYVSPEGRRLMYTQCVERSGDTLASIDDGGSGEKLANGLFTPFQADTPGVECFAQGLSERLPMIRVKCPYFRAKAAQVSRHLPHAERAGPVGDLVRILPRGAGPHPLEKLESCSLNAHTLHGVPATPPTDHHPQLSLPPADGHH